MDFASMRPLEGGWSGETFLAEVGGERAVVRVHARRPARAEADAALHRLVRGLLPVPEVLEVRPPNGEMPSLLVTSYVEGTRGDLVLPGLDADDQRRLGAALGSVAATLAGMPTLTAGELVGPALRVEPWDLPDGLPGFVEQHLDALRHWTFDERAHLVDLAVDAQALLDTVGRTCLVHGDLNPKNVLVDPSTLEVTAVLDWEFAHAGHPFTDLGNLLRLERAPAYADAVLGAYGDRHGVAPSEALPLARAADLWALVDLAGRHGENPVADRADALLRAIARDRDLHAVPVP